MRELTLVLNFALFFITIVNDRGFEELERSRAFGIFVSLILIVTYFLTRKRDLIAEAVSRFLEKTKKQ